MSKGDTFVLRGKLVRKPRSGFSYFGTRNEFRKVLKDAKLEGGEDPIFSRVGNVKIEEDNFDVTLKINRSVLSDLDNDWDREEQICKIGFALEKHFGIGMGMTDEDGKPNKDADKEAKDRLKVMAEKGIIPVAYVKEMEEKDFDSE